MDVDARMLAERARRAAQTLAQASAAERSAAICCAAERIAAQRAEILAANARDLKRAEAQGMTPALLDRLALSDERIEGIVSVMREVAAQIDPLARVVSGHTSSEGLKIERVTVPLGVVAMIYEARPNVTADAFALCMRSGNAVLLKGGSAAQESCLAITQALVQGCIDAGVPADAVAYVTDDADHAQTTALLQAHDLIDVVIPRGSARLIQYCLEHAKVPVIETGTGNCHVYIHRDANPELIVPIVLNAKTQRPGTCNSAESLIVDEVASEYLLPPALMALTRSGVELVGDEQACSIAQSYDVPMALATEDDWGTEYLALKMSVKVVKGLAEAIDHINHYGTRHSEAIITDNYQAAERFLDGVDASAVYVNASTRFTDGGVFGKGGEIGISTQKLHARGPMGAEALTTTKYKIRGIGQTR